MRSMLEKETVTISQICENRISPEEAVREFTKISEFV